MSLSAEVCRGNINASVCHLGGLGPARQQEDHTTQSVSLRFSPVTGNSLEVLECGGLLAPDCHHSCAKQKWVGIGWLAPRSAGKGADLQYSHSDHSVNHMNS